MARSFWRTPFDFLPVSGAPRPEKTKSPAPALISALPMATISFCAWGRWPMPTRNIFKGKIEYWQELISHDTYSDYWKSRNPLPYLKNVQAAVMTVGGWFDAEDAYGALHTSQAMREQNPGAVSIAVEGPWSHGQWNRDAGEALGDVTSGQKTGEYFREHIEFPFFQHYLKDKGEEKLPGAYVFETGRNEWHKLDSWPPPRLQRRHSISKYWQAIFRATFDFRRGVRRIH